MADAKAEAVEITSTGLLDRVQTTSKWLITSFGAFGGFLLAGVQIALLLTNVRGNLSVALAVLGFVIGIACVTAIIIMFGSVVVAPPANLNETARSTELDPITFAPFSTAQAMYQNLVAKNNEYQRLRETDPDNAAIARASAEASRRRLYTYNNRLSEEKALQAFQRATHQLPLLLAGITGGILLFSFGLIQSKALERQEALEKEARARAVATSTLIAKPVVATLTLVATPVSDGGKALAACVDEQRNVQVILNSASITEAANGDPNGYTSRVTPLGGKAGCAVKVYAVPSTDAQIVLR